MNITENILLFIFLVLIFPQTCFCMNHHNCTPSSCGDIHYISLPFRLKNDPKHCGNRDYELACENNVTTVSYNSWKYKVKAINYENFTISLVDVSINNTNTCSFPNRSLNPNNLKNYGYPYRTWYHQRINLPLNELAWPINFMSCPYTLSNSSFLTETNDCVSNSSNSRHIYIKVGHMNASEVRDMCRIDVIVMTSWKFKDVKNVSVSDIHDSLLYGFELSWFKYPCSKCKDKSSCYINIVDNTASCSSSMISFIVVYVVVVFVGVISIPAQIILLGLSFVFRSDWASNVALGRALIIMFRAVKLSLCYPCNKILYKETDNFKQEISIFIIAIIFSVLSLAIRFIIGFICLMGFVIYKFRRRHLSMFDAIETFLRSDNNLVPIRYSYSDIKKMTRGFQEKLGEGGYGKVFKGKLRSGTDVAVKLLRKSKGNGQDFMNEISTIGRIHHVNVVKLVGYCAERSKRALLYDFMPNGSLDKYIYIQNRVNILDWQTKYKIALGVARGIEYLHRGCNIQILHFDIKPHNILLDDKFIPKISDFGLAKFYSTDKKTVTLTAARGTIGYVAPELINRGFGRVSYKADVYSFGMLLIEMVGLKKDLTGNDEKSTQYFPDWIYDSIDQGRDDVIEIGEIVEDEGNDDTWRIARKMTIVALWCIQMSPDNRPSMNKVLEMLEGEVERLQIPQRPTQQNRVVLDEEQSWTTYSTDSTSLLRQDAAPSFEITVQD